MNFDRKYLAWALGYAAVGIAFGIVMAASHNVVQREVHSHTLLVGFVLSLGYGVIHKLWIERLMPILAKTQFIAHQAGTVTMCLGLLLLYGNIAPATLLDPVLGVSSVAILAGVLLMLVMVLKANAAKA
ncbi:MAG: TonB-dependent receptor [Rhodospirillales bacterium]|nr:TonB-dependent receptor [Rhodospirillales bacterium]